MTRTFFLILILTLACASPGCGSSETNKPLVAKGAGEAATASSEGSDANALVEAAAGDAPLLEPFDPPTLAELDAKAEWIDRPVVDPLQLLRDHQAKSPALATVAEALKLRHDSAEANTKILDALGRLPASDDEVDWDATITLHFSADVKSTNPLMVSSVFEGDFGSLTGFGMFGFDWNFDKFALKDYVRTWQTSKDHLCDKVVLRDDMVWSDGKPITAHDVVFTFQTIMNPKVPIPAIRSGTDRIRWVEAYDDHTVVFFHKEALATNDDNLYFSCIPKHLYEKSLEEDPTLTSSEYHQALENDPIAGGPYVMTRRARDQEILLERREDWYMRDGKQVRDKPYFKTVRIRIIADPNTALLALKRGDIEYMQITTPEQWVTQTSNDDFYARNTKVYGIEWTYFYFGWNLRTPWFSDLKVREAMAYAFDYQEMLDKLLYGLFEPAGGIFYPTAWMAPKPPIKPYEQNLDRAEDLLDEAGWVDSDFDGIRDKEIDGKNVKFEFSLIVPSSSQVALPVASLLKQNLEQIGVLCNIRPLEFTVIQQLTQDHSFEAFMGGWGTGADPSTLDNIFKTGEGRNYGHYSNAQVDKLFEEAMREFDRDKRAAMYAQIDEILWQDQPYCWLFYRNAFYGFNRDVRGYVLNPRGVFGYSPGFSSLWKPKR